MKKGKEYTHCVVRFEEEMFDNKSVTDLIPMNWLTDEETTCSYPRKSDYKYLQKWVEECKKPNKSWLHHQQISIIKKTSN